MKSTEIFVEQLIIGLLVLFTWTTLWHGEPPAFLWEGTNDAGLSSGILFGMFIIGLAYVTGIIYDRVADTMLQNIEGYQKLNYTLKYITQDEEKKGLIGENALSEDPFPMQKIQLHIGKDGNDVSERMDYLRSRMRLSRAVATLFPALFLALEMNLAAHEGPILQVLSIDVAILYLMVFLARLFFKGDGSYLVPSTEDLKGSLNEKVNKYFSVHSPVEERCWKPADYFNEPVCWGGGILLITGFILALGAPDRKDPILYLIPFAGAISTILAGWVWWRVSKTFYKLLQGYNKHVMDTSPGDG